MIPVPFIVLGVAATSLGVRHLRKKSSRKEIDENRKNLEAWCRRQRLMPMADGMFDLNAHLPNGNSLIIEALIQGRNDIFELLMAQQVDVNAMNSEGKTALFYCKNNEQIEKLIKAGADVNAIDLQGRSVLFDCKNLDLAKVFVEAGVDVNARDLQSKTAIFDCRNVQIAEVLLKNGADLLVQDDEGKTVLHTMSTEKDELDYSLILTRIYIRHDQKLLNIVDNSGKKAAICDLYLKEEQEVLDDYIEKLEMLSLDELLDYAVDSGKYRLAKIALERGANPNCGHRYMSTHNMFELAVYNNNPEFIPLLVQYGGNVNANTGYFTALERAVMNYHPECVKLFLDYGAKIDENIISSAKYYKHPVIYSLIYKTNKFPPCELIPNEVDLKKYSQTALDQYLIYAIEAYDIENVHRLLSAGANPNAKEKSKGMLVLAVEKNAPEIIQALFDAGADINQKYEHDFTALYYACHHHQYRCVELLLELGAEGEKYELEHSGCTRIRKIWRKYKSSSEMEEKV